MGKMLKYSLIFFAYLGIGVVAAIMNDVPKDDFIVAVIGWPILGIKYLVTRLW